MIRKTLSASLLIAGTAIGAGMLGISLSTGKAGFIPGSLITVLVWLFMLATGLLFLEATLWMEKGANVLSIGERFLGKPGKWFSGGLFIFLYYCLMVAYYSGGSPLISSFLGVKMNPWMANALFGLIFGTMVWIGISFIDRFNYLLMAGLIVSYVFLVGLGSKEVQIEKLLFQDWKEMLWGAPILFAAFGYHNVIPSLADHYARNGRMMRWAIFFGTLIPLIVYSLWQWLTMGILSQEMLDATIQKGMPVTNALQVLTHNPWIPRLANYLAFFAIVTSFLGVAFSMVDFLGDGLRMRRTGLHRLLLCLLVFVPPFIFASFNPGVFLLALGVAGGFGEAYLNGVFPVLTVWLGRYKHKLVSEKSLGGGKLGLAILMAAAAFVMVLEILILLR